MKTLIVLIVSLLTSPAFSVVLPIIDNPSPTEPELPSRYLLTPDRFEIATVFEQPRYSIAEKEDSRGHKVTISFSADYTRLEKFVFSSHPDDFSELTILKGDALPVRVDHLSQIFDEEAIVTWDVIFELNEIHLTYDFSSELDRGAIESLFEGPFIFATVSYDLQCTDKVLSIFCDERYASIPLFNQYLGDVHQQDFDQYEDYRSLQYYQNYYFKFNPFLRGASTEEIDKAMNSELFAGTDCRQDLTDIKSTVCQIIIRRSSNRTFSEALYTIEDEIREFIDLSSSRTFILGDKDFEILGGRTPIDDCCPAGQFDPFL